MATGESWRKYFEKKSHSYLVEQLKVITDIVNDKKMLDKKILSEFSHLQYLSGVQAIIMRVLREKHKDSSSYGGVF